MDKALRHSPEQVRIALLIGGGSKVPAILQCAEEKSNVEVMFVLSCKDKGVGIELARENGIEAQIIRWKDYRKKPEGRKNFSQEVVGMLHARNVDFVIMAGWMVLMPKEFVEEFEGRMVNIHPSILPKYPGDGGKAIQAQWKEKAEPSGCTLHFVDEGTDTGKVILHGYVDVHAYKSVEELADAIHEKEDEVLCKIIEIISEEGVEGLGDREVEIM